MNTGTINHLFSALVMWKKLVGFECSAARHVGEYTIYLQTEATFEDQKPRQYTTFIVEPLAKRPDFPGLVRHISIQLYCSYTVVAVE